MDADVSQRARMGELDRHVVALRDDAPFYTEDELDAAKSDSDVSVNGASQVGRAGVEKAYDRWLRGIEEIPIQQGAQISFELSCNFACEWVAPFGWYWYVPRALRNNTWVVFANSGNKVSGVPDDPAAPRELRHGHCAVIAPDAGRDDPAPTQFSLRLHRRIQVFISTHQLVS